MSKNKFSKRLAASLIAAATIGSSGVLSSLTYLPVHAADTDNYAKLLQYSMYFYDGNMCGDDVDSASAFDWRGDCHTGDEVVGGFHDAGDHVKFGLPAGYSAATLGWGYYEFKDAYDSLGQTAHLKEITNRFCKYFKDCTVLSGDTVSKFCYQIGEGGGGNDHGYWGPPETQESIKGSRKAFWTSNGASDIAAEYAAALAVNYLNFGNAEDLKYAEALYKFSTQYNQCATDGTNGFYTSDTYEDDQAWAAGFLYLATKDDKYKSFMDNFFATGNRQWGEVYTPLGWSNAESGAAALYGEIAGDWKWANSYVSKNCTDKSTFWMPSWASWGSARTNTAMQLVAMVISKHTDNDYSDWCKAQMGMILGDNSTGKNLVVGFNGNSPKYPHHRAASGHAYTSSDEATPTWDETNGHVLVGALVGGPTSSDFSTYNDSIKDAVSNEVALDYNAAFVGAAAALYDKYKTGSLESNIPGVGATPTTTATTTATTGKTTTTAAVTTTKAAETTKAPTTVAQGDGCYTKKVNQDVVYKELPAADKMLGWSYEDLGVKAGEKVQKVEIDISTTADKIGKWQGAFGSSTTVDPDYWTQTEDMQQVIDGDSGTLVWNVDSATSDIIQTQYGGQVKVGFWWIDCNEFTIDAVRVYTDKSSTNPTTTAAVTTATTKATTKATTTTTKAATTTAAPATTAAPTTTTKLVVGNEPTMAVNNGQKIFATPGQEYAEIPLNLYNVPDTEGITVAFKTDAEGTPTLALLKDAYQLYEAADAFVNLGKWEANPKGLSWGVPSSGKQMVKSGDFADGDVFLSLYYNIPDEATVKDIAKANGMELKHNAEYGAYYEFPLVFEREKLNNKDGKLLDWVGTNNTKVNATYIDSNLIVKVSDTGETTTTATTTSGGDTTTTEVVTTASSAPVTTSPDATTTTTSVSYNGESFEWVLGKYKADGSYEPRTFVKAGQKSASAVAPKVYGDPGINSANIRLEGDAAKALLAAGTYVGLTKNADYDTQLAGEGGTTWLDNAAQLRFAFASNDVNNTNNAKTADGSAIGELVYDIPDAETVKSIADQYGISLVTGTDDEGNEVSYYEFPLTWSEAVGEHGETATQCGSYVDGALVEIPYDQYTRRDGTICVVVPSETTTTAATTTTAEVTTTTEAVTTAAVDTTTEVPATTTTAAATTTTEAATTTTEAATTTTEAATTTTEAATTTTEAATTTTEAVTTTTEAATTTTEAATTTTEAATTTTEAVTTTTEAATTTTEAATTTTEAATTTTEAATTTTTTEATTTSTTEATTTTSATTTQPQPNVTTIVFELADPNFYFSVDEREFKATDLFKSVTLISTDADGKIVSQEDIIDKVNFNGATPKSTYAQTEKYFVGEVQAYYNNGTENVLIPGATPTVYIGVKGDADLNGLEDVPDAVSILTYYAKIAAGQQGIVFNEDPMLNKLAYFLADVDTESKAGENTDGKLMEVNDAVYVLTYYAKKAAGQGPTWPDVIPSLKSLEGSMWYEG